MERVLTIADHDAEAGKSGGWTAVVLAGERPDGDPLACALGVQAKALIEIGGQTMLARVVEALLGAAQISKVLVLAQKIDAIAEAEPSSILRDQRVKLMASGNGIASSIRSLLDTPDAPWPVLVTTADNALLTTQRVEAFLNGAQRCDIAVGVSERSVVEKRFPETKRTWLKFRDGQYSGANLFAFMTPQCLPAIDHWQEVEQDRKKGIKLIASFGPSLLLTFLLRRVGFERGLGLAGQKMGLHAKPVALDAEAPIDVDKREDLTLVEQIIAERSVPSQPIRDGVLGANPAACEEAPKPLAQPAQAALHS